MRRYPCHDLFHEKSSRTDHIRLISEGGSSLAPGSGALCIDSIQVTHNCTTESQHSAYRSVTGAYTMVSSADTSVFSVSAELASYLDRGIIPATLQERFEQQGIRLSDQARVQVQQSGRVWVLADHNNRYSIRRLSMRLTVYRDRSSPP